jgi:Ca2+/Na+ antiporter
MHPGWIGAVAGGAIGLAGGIIGTAAGVRSARGPRERAYMVRAAALFWTAGLTFLTLLLLLPSPWRFLMWAPWSLLMPLGIVTVNRGLARRRAEDSSA